MSNRKPARRILFVSLMAAGCLAALTAQSPAADRIGPPAIEAPAVPVPPAGAVVASPAAAPAQGGAVATPPAPGAVNPQPPGAPRLVPPAPVRPAGAVAPTAARPAGPAVPGPGAGPVAVPTPGATPGTLGPAVNRQQRFVPVLPPKDYQPPVLYIDQPRYDFGDVIKGEVVSHRFEVENKGGSPLIIQKVKPSCGCTLVDEAAMDKVIAPGGKGGFELKIETSRLTAGRQQKYADVSSNDPKQSQFRVFIGGKIDSLLKVDPEQPKIQTVKGKGQGSTDISITKNIAAEIKILGAKSQSGRLLVDLKEVQPANQWKLAVTTNYGPKETQSYYNELIQVEVQMGEKKLNQDISLPVQVKDRIEINPRSVYFKRTDFQPLKDKGTPIVKTVDLKPAIEEGYQFKITGTKVDDPDNFFKVKVDTVKEGREYRVNVSVDKLPPDQPADAKAASKSMKANITLNTDDPMMPEIVVRCIAFF